LRLFSTHSCYERSGRLPSRFSPGFAVFSEPSRSRIRAWLGSFGDPSD
jgi:hypothetical protein